MIAEYFSHDYKARSDAKMVRLFMKHGMEGIGIFWCLVEMLYEEEGYLPVSECERIAFELRTEYDRITSVLNDFDLFKTDGMTFWSDSILKRIEARKEISDKNRKNVLKRWEKYDRNTTVIPPNESGNTIKEKKIKENEKKESKETPPDQIDPNSLSREKNLQTFHHFWEAYDKKNGKEKAFEIWITISIDDQRKALKGAKIYKENEPDSQFRSNPERFLSEKEWNDEKATKKKQPKKDKFPRASLGIDRPFCEPKEVTS